MKHNSTASTTSDLPAHRAKKSGIGDYWLRYTPSDNTSGSHHGGPINVHLAPIRNEPSTSDSVASDNLSLALSTARLNNFRSHRYGLVYSALSKMAQLPKGHPLSVDPSLARLATAIVVAIENISDAKPPSVYPEDDDALILKWADHRIERLLAIVGEEIEVSTEDIATCETRTVEFGEKWQANLPKILEEIRAKFSTSTDQS